MTIACELAQHVRDECSKVIVGQRQLIDDLLLVVLTNAHALIEGVPGLAKTLAVKTLAQLFQFQFQRVQCTPDLIPADILGANVFNQALNSFSLHRGPIFTDLLLVDEINRTPPRTQSALLEAMEETQVTIDGTTHLLSRNFGVFATQNPIEFEGTYPLPEAQLDRFLMKIRIRYPESAEERTILERYQTGFEPRSLDRLGLRPVVPAMLENARQEVKQVRVEPALFDYIIAIVRQTRQAPAVSLGASPRAAIALMFVAKATAATEGRDFVVPDDVKASALSVLRHRLMLKPEADLEGLTTDDVVRETLSGVEVPQ
ncbi:MAG: MoxR family ATPase [Candidatus Acidiferrales bacterium]